VGGGAARARRARDACRAADCDYERVQLDRPLDESLLRFLGRRGGKL
jgi:hypothetical protein